jgi:hypothetical protein
MASLGRISIGYDFLYFVGFLALQRTVAPLYLASLQNWVTALDTTPIFNNSLEPIRKTTLRWWIKLGLAKNDPSSSPHNQIV